MVIIFSTSIFTFYYFIILRIVYPKSKFFLYIQSDRRVEVQIKTNKIISYFFGFIENVMKLFSTTIRASEIKFHDKEILISPSVISDTWYDKPVKNRLNSKVKLLYVGRIRKEKGIFSLVKLLEEIELNLELVIVGNEEKVFLKNRFKIIEKGFIQDETELIKEYDNSNIVIIPSFTESYSKVIDEALARIRPVIIFNEIEYLSKKEKVSISVKGIHLL